MDSTERISQLSHRIFNTTLTEKRVGRSSNPFATPTFTGLQMDVFASSKVIEPKAGLTQKAKNFIRRKAATFVSGINDIGEKFWKSVEAVKEFGIWVKDGVVCAINKVKEIGSIEVNFGAIGERIKNAMSINSRERELKSYMKKDVAELSDELAHYHGLLLKEAETEKISLVA